jgi:23S rRNA pseudouridine2605 synthase
MHPSFEIKKVYFVRTWEPIDNPSLSRLRKGIMIDGEKTPESRVRRISDNEVEITIHEGSNRIIRRMIEAVNNQVKLLIRTQIGELKLGQIKPGYYKNLTEEEKRLIFVQREQRRI